jgi:hypothetical protein
VDDGAITANKAVRAEFLTLKRFNVENPARYNLIWSDPLLTGIQPFHTSASEILRMVYKKSIRKHLDLI